MSVSGDASRFLLLSAMFKNFFLSDQLVEIISLTICHTDLSQPCLVIVSGESKPERSGTPFR